ncbi:hypothetical protein SAMN05446935_10502 [Burkholderia sp. YR290]|nr:hypothetical protein SAMN05446934_7919 [Paraburkholderia hospita]SOE91166.1 hypothetical protein SAMN05446935_10502 [Burkholderia sp. YR290]
MSSPLEEAAFRLLETRVFFVVVVEQIDIREFSQIDN